MMPFALQLCRPTRQILRTANLMGSVRCRRARSEKREASQPPRPRCEGAESFTRFADDPSLCHPFLIGALHSTALPIPSDSALFTTLHQSPPWLSHLSSIVRHTLFSLVNHSISLVKLHSFAFARHPPM